MGSLGSQRTNRYYVRYTALVVVSFLVVVVTIFSWFFFMNNSKPGGELEIVENWTEFEEEEEKEPVFVLSHHNDDDPDFFPRPKKLMIKFPERSNFYYGYYLANNIDLEGNFIHKLAPFLEEEDVDCDELNEEHRQLMVEKGFIIDVEERIKNSPKNFTSLDIEVWKLWNNDYFDMNILFSYLCKEKKFRNNRRNRNKTAVKWKEGDRVIIYSDKTYQQMEAVMNQNCSVEVEVRHSNENLDAHIHLVFHTARHRELADYGKSYPNYYKAHYAVESCSQFGYDLFIMTANNYDYEATYHAMSEIPVYNDWDQERYMSLSPSDPYVRNIRKLFGYDTDHLKTYDQLREATIRQIRNVHKKKKHAFSAFISHCDDVGNLDRNDLNNWAFKRPKNKKWIRPRLVNIFHDHYGVVNYGSCGGLYKMDKGTEKSKYKKLASKIYYMNQYPFFLAFENRMIDAYTGAKLHHALFAKYTIPVYYGDPFIDSKFPPHLLEKYKVFIDLADFNTISNALEYMGYLMNNETAYLEYFEWRFDKVYRYLPRTVRYAMHDEFDSAGRNVVLLCRLAELFVEERLRYYPEQSKRDEGQGQRPEQID